MTHYRNRQTSAAAGAEACSCARSIRLSLLGTFVAPIFVALLPLP